MAYRFLCQWRRTKTETLSLCMHAVMDHLHFTGLSMHVYQGPETLYIVYSLLEISCNLFNFAIFKL